MDNWINLNMDPAVAAELMALRPALEELVTKAAGEPEQVLEMSPVDQEVCLKQFSLLQLLIKIFFLYIAARLSD